MKKILLILSICFVSWSAQAVTMCAQDDAIVIPYSGVAINNNWPSSTNNGGKWTVTTSFGMFMGVSACLNVSGTNHTVNTSVVASGGEQAGAYCWCKMLHPFVSYWMYVNTGYWMSNCGGYSGGNSDTVAACNSGCTYRCANQLRCDSEMRKNIFTGIQ